MFKGDAGEAVVEAMRVALRSAYADAIADAEFVVAMAAWGRNDLDTAKMHLARAVARIDELDDPRIALKALQMEHLLEARRDQVRAALLLARRGVELSRRYGWPEGELNGFLGEAMGLSTLGDSRTALVLLRRARRLAGEIGNRRHELLSGNSVASILAEMDQIDEALGVWRQVLKDAEAFAPYYVSSIRLIMALYLIEYDRDLEEAEQYLMAVRRSADPQEVAEALAGLGALRLKQHRPEEALVLATEALILADSSNAPGGQIGFEPWRAHLLKSRALRSARRVREAEQQYRVAIAAIEANWNDVEAGGVRLARFFRDKSAAYHELAEVLADRGEVREALRGADAYKGRAIFAEMQFANSAGDGTDISSSDRLARASLRGRIESLNRAAMTTKSRARRQSLMRELSETRDALDRLETLVALKSPRVGGANNQLPDPLSDPRLIASSNRVILEFLVGPRSSTIFVISREGTDLRVYAHRIAAGRDDLKPHVESLQRGLEQRSIEYCGSNSDRPYVWQGGGQNRGGGR